MDLGLVLISAVIALLCFVLHERGTLRFVYLTTRIPGPSKLGLLRAAKDFLKFDDVLQTVSNVIVASGYKPFGLWINHRIYAVVVSDTESVSRVYANKDIADKPDFIYDSLAWVFGANMLANSGEKFRRVKKTIEPVFKIRLLELHLPRINGEAKLLAEELRTVAAGNTGDGEDAKLLIETRVWLAAISIMSSGTFAASRSLAQTWLRIAHEANDLVALRSFNSYYYSLLYRHKASAKQQEKKVKTEVAGAKRIILEELRARRAKLEADGEGPYNVMDLAAREPSQLASQNGVGFLDEEEAVSEVLFMILAASDTTSAALNVCVLLLALHQDVQERALQEVESVLGDRDEADQGDTVNMVYLEKIIKESLRLFPVGPFIAKRAVQETTLNGFTVPQGTLIGISIWDLHRSPKVYEEPLKFNPDRFSSRAEEPYSWIAFSHGRRRCPGQWLAMCTLKIFLSHILRNVKILPRDGLESIHDIKVKVSLDLNVLELPLRFTPRQRATGN